MFVVGNRKIFFWISSILTLASIIAIVVFGLPLGIDFRGGSLIEIEYMDTRPDITLIERDLSVLEIGDVLVQPTGDKGYIIRMRDLDENGHRRVIGALLDDSGGQQLQFEEKQFTSIGPTIGEELKKRAVIALSLTIVFIILFVAFAFRHVSRPVSSWRYGLVAILALAHDIIIPAGFVSFMGRFSNMEVDALFITALLAILGLSVNDTIVVFDRIRENLRLRISKHFDETVSISLKQTISRSINTSLTTLFVLLALYFIGPDSTKNFALILSLGLIVGTYSSIFLASPLLVAIAKRQKR